MREKLHSLKKGRIRQSWNKYNLYNLAQQKRFMILDKTYFQQKYAAKQESRRYHGEHLTKRAWQNIFKHSLHAVVPMNTKVLAGNDGSEQAMGRGAGLDPGITEGGGQLGVVGGITRGENMRLTVPYMHQMWAPMERRLDMAIFRAMFASSARQARQFVVHGFVKVNGKKMKHPGYMLNPGDMFSVDPDKVLYATGAPKHLIPPKKTQNETSEGEEALGEDASVVKEAALEALSPSPADGSTDSDVEKAEQEANESDSKSESENEIERERARERARAQEQWQNEIKEDPLNPIDLSKPYLTPWRPRDYLSPFAFIPRYLEVNFNICHAVYLQHPVARPGASEIPSPFGHDVHQLAFHWFLRRR